MKSWKTTLGGLFLTLGTVLSQTENEYAALAGTILIGVSGVLLGQARDNNVSSEEVGAK